MDKEIWKRNRQIFYNANEEIFKKEDLCVSCFFPNVICNQKCRPPRNNSTLDPWNPWNPWKYNQKRKEIIFEKLPHLCWRKLKIIKELFSSWYSIFGRHNFLYSEFISFIKQKLEREGRSPP